MIETFSEMKKRWLSHVNRWELNLNDGFVILVTSNGKISLEIDGLEYSRADIRAMINERFDMIDQIRDLINERNAAQDRARLMHEEICER